MTTLSACGLDHIHPGTHRVHSASALLHSEKRPFLFKFGVATLSGFGLGQIHPDPHWVQQQGRVRVLMELCSPDPRLARRTNTSYL